MPTFSKGSTFIKFVALYSHSTGMSQEKVELDEKNEVLIQVLPVDHSSIHPTKEAQQTELEQTSSFDSNDAGDDAKVPDGGLRAWLVVFGVRFCALNHRGHYSFFQAFFGSMST